MSAKTAREHRRVAALQELGVTAREAAKMAELLEDKRNSLSFSIYQQEGEDAPAPEKGVQPPFKGYPDLERPMYASGPAVFEPLPKSRVEQDPRLMDAPTIEETKVEYIKASHHHIRVTRENLIQLLLARDIPIGRYPKFELWDKSDHIKCDFEIDIRWIEQQPSVAPFAFEELTLDELSGLHSEIKDVLYLRSAGQPSGLTDKEVAEDQR